jgi:predicted transcriptional regulator
MNDNTKFVVKHRELLPKEETTVTMSLRIDRDTQEKYDELSTKSGRSRNELMNSALSYALQNLEFIDKKSKQ